MNFDKPLISVLLGFAATIPYEIFTRIMLLLGIGKYSVYQLSSLIVTLDRPTAVLGVATSSSVGIAIALIFYFSLKTIGIDYIIIKGLLAGLFGWIVCEVLYTFLLEGPPIITPRPISDYYVQLLGSCVYGLTLGLLFRKFILPDLRIKNN